MSYQETAPEGFVTEYAITLGIFDDGDLVPTVVFGVILPYEGCDLIALAAELTKELLLAARKEYGTRIKHHAAFWSGSERQVPRAESLAAMQVQPQGDTP